MRLTNLIRIIFARETLPHDPTITAPRRRGLESMLSALLAPERLPQDPPPLGREASAGEMGRRSVFKALFMPEPLPRDLPPFKEERKRMLKILLEGESLPRDPPSPPKKKGLLKTILARETLPREPEEELR